MNEALAALQASPLGAAIRAAGVWSYGVVNAVHIVGIATLFGSILVLDLRLLGWRPGRPLHDVAAGTVPVAAAGLSLALLSGLCLLSTNATEYEGNPFLLIKFAAIAFGLVNLALLHRSPTWRAVRERRTPDESETTRLKIAGGASLIGWLTTIVAGRMMGYW